MQRILVMGSSGSGKSTFTRRLSAITGLPTVSLDALFWNPGWVPSDATEFEQRVSEAAHRPGWIMDGNFISHGGEIRRGLADAVVWFDLPTRTCMTGILTRILMSYGRVRPEMAPGCPERFDLDFFHYVWTYRQLQRPKLLRYFEGLRPDQALISFTSRAHADQFLADLTPAAHVVSVR